MHHSPDSSGSVVLHVVEDVAGLAVQGLADRGERGEADGGDVVVLDLRQVHVGDADAVGQPVQAPTAFDHHSVQSQDDPAHAASPPIWFSVHLQIFRI